MTRLTWREIHEDDLPECLSMRPANLGDEIAGRDAALQVWRELLGCPVFHGIVIEAAPAVCGRRIVGCGAGVFVSRDFMSAEIANPRPGLNSRIIASLAQRTPALLPYDAVGRANAGDGLDVVNLIGSWIPAALSEEELARIRGLLAASFLEVHRGYRLNRVLRELVTDEELTACKDIFRVIATFPELRHAAILLTKEDVSRVPFSPAGLMFEYHEPILRLNESERRLLIAARGQQTDEQLGIELDATPAVIKKRWVSIFEKVMLVRPDLLEGLEPNGDSGRGRQKRHHVLAYVRAHPEELRPYAWRRSAKV